MIIIGSDHAGFDLKNLVIKYFIKQKIEYLDASSNEKNVLDDYPDIAICVCKKVLEQEQNIGIAICGSGIGISIACNKIKGIFAANCFDEYTAQKSREDNNANVLCLGGRLSYSENEKIIEEIVNIFLNTNFLGNRHSRRIDKIVEMERNFGDKL